MKYLLSILFLAFSLSMNAQHLNKYGHIIDHNIQPSYKFVAADQGHITIKYKNQTYQATTLIELSTGFVTIQNTCGNTPSLVSFYDKNGILRKTLQFDQTINPETDKSNRYLYFVDNAKTTIFDTENFSKKTVPTFNDIAISKTGDPIYYNSRKQLLITSDQTFELPFLPFSIEIDDMDEIYAFGRDQFAQIKEGQLSTHNYQNATFFESKVINGKVLWVEKQKEGQVFLFNMYQTVENKIIKTEKQSVDMSKLSKAINYSRDDGDKIVCPMFPDIPDYPFRIGNSYAEHQNYGTFSYLHPGIDILGEAGQEVYSPVDGFVKAILSSGGEIQWRLALGLEDAYTLQDGYLFAHLDPETIPFAVGDKVNAGDYMGSLVLWPAYDFHHLHFARLQHLGVTWGGNWLTKHNVLSDITNFKDESNPVFEPLWNDQTIAFRAKENTEILDPANLKGSFDIICHAHDKSNDEWRLDVDSLWFEIIDLNTNDVAYKQESFSYNFTLDFYSTNIQSSRVLNTIYAVNEVWETLGNYEEREFYQQVSRSNGDGKINHLDESVYFNSKIIPNGSYLIRIHAYDAVKNHSSTELEVTINNDSLSMDEVEIDIFTIYPNPSSGQFTIQTNDETITQMDIINNLGQIVEERSKSSFENVEFNIPHAGIYFVRAFSNDNELLKIEKLIVRF